MLKNKWVPFLLLIPFLIGFLFAVTGISETFDHSVFLWCRQHLSPALDVPFKILTMLGSEYGVVLICFALLLIPGSASRIGIPAAMTSFFSWLLNTGIKYAVRRVRPEFMVFDESGYSFPSGHAMNNAALYIAVLLALLLLVKNRRRKGLLTALFLLLPLLIGISRVFFGVHFLTDVVSGWFLGAFVAVIVHRFYFERINRKRD